MNSKENNIGEYKLGLSILEGILKELRLDLSREEKVELDEELVKKFVLIDRIGYCEELAARWETEREETGEFILEWAKRKRIKRK